MVLGKTGTSQKGGRGGTLDRAGGAVGGQAGGGEGGDGGRAARVNMPCTGSCKTHSYLHDSDSHNLFRKLLGT